MQDLTMERRAELYRVISDRYNLRWFERSRLDANEAAYETALQLADLSDWDRLDGVICELKGPRGEWVHSCGHAHEPDESCPQSPCGKYICCIN